MEPKPEPKPGLKPRPRYLNQLIAARNNGLIKVITGMRRCGKSSLMALYAQWLAEHGVDESRIIMVNLESFQYQGLDHKQLYHHLADRMPPEGRSYLLLDEVQLIEHWESAVNALRVDKDVDIYLTGSNAHLLSSQLGTLLTGRYMEIGAFPLSFSEFITYTGETDMPRAFERYTRYGGLPPVVDQGTDQALARTVLSGVYNTVFVRDIAQYLQVRNPMVFDDIARYLADTAGSSVSIVNIEHRLKSARRPTANETIERYISGLLDAFLFYRARRINVKGGDYLQGLAKYYPADLGIRNMLLGYPTGDFGFLLENVVHNELRVRGYDVQVGKINGLEIDFVATRMRDDLSRERLFIQVSASIMDPQTRRRELEPLRQIATLVDVSDERIVLTLDAFGLGRAEGIAIVNVLEWLCAD